MAANYLKEYSDTVEALPLELQRNYKLIRQLDQDAEELMSQVAQEVTSLSSQSTTVERRRAYLERIGQLLNESLKKGEEKFALAKSTYDTVDRHCTRLDNDLQKIEDEQLIGPARHQEKRRREETEQETEMPVSPRKKKQKEREVVETSDTYLSTEDAREQAKAAASLNDLPIDPNEPRYCYCDQVSFGEMVACDNEECEIEWFHLECVGLKTPPKGKWYCNDCLAILKRKKKL